MKKISILSLISALSCSTFTYAGAMGEGDFPYCFSSFVLLEAGLASSTIDDYDLVIYNAPDLAFSTTKDDQAGAGRLAVGVMNKIDELGLSAEMGWGLYGRTTRTAVEPSGYAAFSTKYTLTGLDILAGIAWVPSNFSLFLKMGAMIQNMGETSTSTFSQMGPPDSGADYTNTLTIEENHTQVLPEIKIGGGYNLNENWAITVSGFYVLGSTVKASGTIDFDGGLNNNLTISRQNPSLGGVLVGVQFSI